MKIKFQYHTLFGQAYAWFYKKTDKAPGRPNIFYNTKPVSVHRRVNKIRSFLWEMGQLYNTFIDLQFPIYTSGQLIGLRKRLEPEHGAWLEWTALIEREYTSLYQEFQQKEKLVPPDDFLNSLKIQFEFGVLGEVHSSISQLTRIDYGTSSDFKNLEKFEARMVRTNEIEKAILETLDAYKDLPFVEALLRRAKSNIKGNKRFIEHSIEQCKAQEGKCPFKVGMSVLITKQRFNQTGQYPGIISKVDPKNFKLVWIDCKALSGAKGKGVKFYKDRYGSWAKWGSGADSYGPSYFILDSEGKRLGR